MEINQPSGGSSELEIGTTPIIGGTNGNFLYNNNGVLGEQAGGGGSMVYPGAGIALSTGTGWNTSITNNSANWNTAYGWGNHASAGYLTASTLSIVSDSPLSGAGTSASHLTITPDATHRWLTDTLTSTWNGKQNAITTGTTAQYLRGDLSLATFPTIPSVGTWGALNYPSWTTGTPFVKMTAAGTFSLDTNTYALSAHDQNASTIIIPSGIGTPTYDDIQDFINTTQSSGRISGGVITDGGSGTVNISELQGMIRAGTTLADPITYFKKTATTGLAVSAGTNFILATWSSAGGGSVVYSASATRPASGTYGTFVLGRVFYTGTNVEVQTTGQNIYDEYGRIQDRMLTKYGFMDRATGGTLSAHATPLRLTCSAGVWYTGNTQMTTADQTQFNVWYKSGSATWVEGGLFTLFSEVFDGVGGHKLYESYQNGNAIATLGAGRYGVYWIFECPKGDLYVVMDSINTGSIATAQAATVPSSLPPYCVNWAKLVGRVIIKKSDTAFYSVESSFAQSFTLSSAVDHASLFNLEYSVSGHTGFEPTITAGTSAQFLKGDKSLDSSTYLTSVTAHNLLSATHGDTLTGSVVAGDLMIGNATPKWSRLGKGTDGYVLTIDSSTHLPSWKASTSQWLNSGSDIYFNTGNVAIGKDYADTKLDVNGLVSNEGLIVKRDIFTMSIAPLRYGGVDYDGAGGEAVIIVDLRKFDWYIGTSPQTIPLSDGFTNYGVALINILSGNTYVTIYFKEGDFIGPTNPSPGTDDDEYLDTYILVHLGLANTVDYYITNMWTATGNLSGGVPGYAWNNPDNLTIVSGSTDPATFDLYSTSQTILQSSGYNKTPYVITLPEELPIAPSMLNIDQYGVMSFGGSNLAYDTTIGDGANVNVTFEQFIQPSGVYADTVSVLVKSHCNAWYGGVNYGTFEYPTTFSNFIQITGSAATITFSTADRSITKNLEFHPSDESLNWASKFAMTGLPIGTLASPPSGLLEGDLWLDVTTSATYPIVRSYIP